MRTTLDSPEQLIEVARRMFGFKSTTETVVFALPGLVRRGQIEQLKSMTGSIRLDVGCGKSGGVKQNR
jgi:hypothetical protein